MGHLCKHAAMRTDRRSFLLGTAGALAAGFAASLHRPEISEAKSSSGKIFGAALAAPKPILAGETIPGLVIHELLAGTETIVLPFTGLQLIGLNVEPSTITDFNGVTALAYHAGTATDSNGTIYNLETDIRVMEGEYVGEDGERHRGTFAEMWIDLFAPGSGEQVHDFNGGIPASGLFWTVELPPESFSANNGQRQARLILRNLPLIDTFQFLGPNSTPAVLDMTIEWQALESPVSLGSGNTVPPTDPAAFLGSFAKARSTAQISGRELGFSFTSNPGVSSDLGYAEIGTERNGVFL